MNVPSFLNKKSFFTIICMVIFFSISTLFYFTQLKKESSLITNNTSSFRLKLLSNDALENFKKGSGTSESLSIVTSNDLQEKIFSFNDLNKSTFTISYTIDKNTSSELKRVVVNFQKQSDKLNIGGDILNSYIDAVILSALIRNDSNKELSDGDILKQVAKIQEGFINSNKSVKIFEIQYE